MESIKLLDCTLRDGGQGLEDLNKNGINTEVFEKEDRVNIANNLVDANIDIIELGCMVKSNINNERYAIYNNIENLSQYIPYKKNKNQMFVGLYTGPDTDITEIPNHNDNLIDGVRVILRYSELEKSLRYCSELAKKGYKVFVQPMLTMRYTTKQLDYLIKSANDMGAYALYFVDSYGYMDDSDVDRLFDVYNSGLRNEIRIGFHAHNNMQMAMQNVKCFLKKFEYRNIIVDACAVGMGQGAGNAQTELVASYMNNKYGKNYDISSILNVCDTLEKFRKGEMETWGYSAVRAISAINGAAYKYAVSMKLTKNMKLSEINEVFKRMPEDLKYRYTEENLEYVLKNVWEQ